MITIGIETSCDETSVAFLKDGRKVLSNVVYSSLSEHKKYGGVVPEIASRSHLEVLLHCVESARKKARVSLSDVDLVAVTHGPGLMGSLLVGLSGAKAMAYFLKKPLIGVDHVLAHVHAGMLSDSTLRYPFLGLAVSGGHTMLIRMQAADKVEVLGSTLDDAAGEAFDKVAKMLGLGYPGGPEVDRLSRGEDPKKSFFSRPFLSSDSLDFSFSGIKTAVFYKVEALKKAKALTPKAKKEICAGFQEAVCETLTKKTLRAMKQYNLRSCVVGGGVSANQRLRQMMAQAAKKEGFRIIFPPLSLCQDNAAMIAGLGTALFKAGQRHDVELAGYADFSDNKDVIFRNL